MELRFFSLGRSGSRQGSAGRERFANVPRPPTLLARPAVNRADDRGATPAYRSRRTSFKAETVQAAVVTGGGPCERAKTSAQKAFEEDQLVPLAVAHGLGPACVADPGEAGLLRDPLGRDVAARRVQGQPPEAETAVLHGD